MKDLALRALDLVARRGVTYADVRAIESRERDVSTKNGKAGHVSSSESMGLGIRVLANGCWGFAATDDLTKEGIEAAAGLALEIAHSGSAVKKQNVALAEENAYQMLWVSSFRVDPFSIPVDRNLATLLAVDTELRRDPAVTLAEASMHFERKRQVFVSTVGSVIDQTRYLSGAGFTALCYKDGEIQKRSYPNSFGGQYQLKGYELVEELDLLAHAPRIAEEAVALHSADQCPEGQFDLILDSSQLGLQIHESIGHPIELDRVLGSEANYAGMSFLTLDQLRRLRYGSEIVNVVCDAREEHGPGLGTFAFDDEGVPAQRNDIIRGGQFVGYMTSRETAAAIGETRSNGCMRADGWSRLPLIRMTNVSLLPGEQSLEEVFDVDHGIYMETNKSWSIDDKRFNFQFGCEIAWEIRRGKRVRMLKNPSYSGISTEFWNACTAIAGPEHWTLWGVPNCGKGQPEQVMGTGHGASPARFRAIKVGSAYAG
ncbi:MAG TPA: TldD/PmbA family protein [Candidatus Sulfopaludibacter sp.]|jgi:TldD protein|nr:TldD/PmbA family protein [Candidatus Sulfopaludibacter sp.]